MPAGVDFHEHLQAILADCGALLVVIGKSWRSQRKGQPARIMDPDDWVRIEVETALERRIPVVPLLIDGALAPEPRPASRNPVAAAPSQCPAVDSGRDFHAQMSRLVRDLQGSSLIRLQSSLPRISDSPHVDTNTPARSPNWQAIGRWFADPRRHHHASARSPLPAPIEAIAIKPESTSRQAHPPEPPPIPAQTPNSKRYYLTVLTRHSRLDS